MGGGQFGAPVPIRREAEVAELDEDEDETLWERICMLNEMFPGRVRSLASWSFERAHWLLTGGWSFARKGTWVVATTGLIGLLPVLFEKERMDMEEMSRKNQQMMLLGPGAVKGQAKGQIGMLGPVMGVRPGA